MGKNLKSLLSQNRTSIFTHTITKDQAVLQMSKEFEFDKVIKIFEEDNLTIKPFKGMYLNLEVYTKNKRYCDDIDLIANLTDFRKIHELLLKNGYRKVSSLVNIFRLQVTYKKKNIELDIHYCLKSFTGKRNYYLFTKSKSEELVLNMFFLIDNCIRDLVFDEKRIKDISNLAYLIDLKLLEIFVARFKMKEKIEIYISFLNGKFEEDYPILHKASLTSGYKRKLYKLILGNKIFD